jgi:hypothetical protein
MRAQGRKVGHQRSSLFSNRKSEPKRQKFPQWQLAKELAKVEEVKRRWEWP